MQLTRCPLSIGPIEADEIVALGLYSTAVFDPVKGELQPHAIKTSDLLPDHGHNDQCGDSSGLSVGRVQKPNGEAELLATIMGIASRPTKAGIPRVVEGYSTIQVQELLAIGDNILSVLDDGKEGFRTHAVVRATEGEGKGRLRLVRNQLITRLNKSFCRFTAPPHQGVATHRP